MSDFLTTHDLWWLAYTATTVACMAGFTAIVWAACQIKNSEIKKARHDET